MPDSYKYLDLLNKYATRFKTIAQITSITLFHGTDISYIPSIASEGLVPMKPNAPTAAKGVYLTPDFATAARYAGTVPSPAILEVVISSPHRIKQIQEDSLDQPWTAYSDEPPQEAYWNDDIRRIEQNAADILGIQSTYSGPIDLRKIYEVEQFRGINIYKQILDIARQQNMDIIEIKKRIQDIMPPGTEYEYFNIAPDGSLRLSEDVYKQMHQMHYPKTLPPTTIKAIWAPANKVRPLFRQFASQSTTSAMKLLPGEINSIREVLESAYRDSAFGKSDPNEIIEGLGSYNIHGVLDDTIKALRENTNDLEQFQTILDWASNEEFGLEDVYAQEEEWLRFAIGGKINLRTVHELYETP